MFSLQVITRLHCKRVVWGVYSTVSILIVKIKTTACVCTCVLEMGKMFPCAARLPVSPFVWRTLWIIHPLLPQLPHLFSLSLSLSPSLSVAFSDTFPLSSVPLRGPVTQQSLNHRFEVSLLCLETYGIGRKGKSNTDPGSMGEYIPSCGFECCIALPGSPPVVGPTSLYARVLVIALCGIKCLIRGWLQTGRFLVRPRSNAVLQLRV